MKKLPIIARVISSGALVFLFANCEPSGGASSGGASSVRSGGLHAQGKHLYLTRCTSCHAAEPLGDYSASEWRDLMPEMAAESKLSAAQERAVLQYVLSGASP